MPTRSRASTRRFREFVHRPSANIPRKRLKQSVSPLAKRMQHHFGVAARSKSTPAGDELQAKLGVIVDLAVKDENQVAVLTDHRLVAVEQIDDLQAHRSQRDILRFVHTVLIGPSVYQRLDGIANMSGTEYTIPMRKPSDATQILPPVAGEKRNNDSRRTSSTWLLFFWGATGTLREGLQQP